MRWCEVVLWGEACLLECERKGFLAIAIERSIVFFFPFLKKFVFLFSNRQEIQRMTDEEWANLEMTQVCVCVCVCVCVYYINFGENTEK